VWQQKIYLSFVVTALFVCLVISLVSCGGKGRQPGSGPNISSETIAERALVIANDLDQKSIVLEGIARDIRGLGERGDDIVAELNDAIKRVDEAIELISGLIAREPETPERVETNYQCKDEFGTSSNSYQYHPWGSFGWSAR